jgi:DNA-directed RNA polymerase subunit RPC12/RpoP
VAKHTSKFCSRCGKEFPATLEFFHKHNSTKDRLSQQCKFCRSELAREYFKKPGVKERQRECRKALIKSSPEKYIAKRRANREKALEYKLMRDWGLSIEDYNSILKSQNGVCAICGKPETWKQKGEIKRLVVDHDHTTGKVRGLLCHRCNLGVGTFNDNVAFLKNVIEYLEANCG